MLATHKKLFFSAIGILIFFLCIIAFLFFEPISTHSSNKVIDISVYMPPTSTTKIFAIHNPEDKIVFLEEEILSKSTKINTIDYTSILYGVKDETSVEPFSVTQGFYLLENEFISITKTSSTLSYINTDADYIIYNTFAEDFPKVRYQNTQRYISSDYTTVTTPIKEYDNCIEVITQTKDELTIKTYYAPNIGKVMSRAETAVGSNEFFLYEILVEVKPSDNR